MDTINKRLSRQRCMAPSRPKDRGIKKAGTTGTNVILSERGQGDAYGWEVCLYYPFISEHAWCQRIRLAHA